MITAQIGSSSSFKTAKSPYPLFKSARHFPLFLALPCGLAGRPGPDLNRRTRLCRPLPNHSATGPRRTGV